MLEQADAYGQTPLLWAAAKGHTNVVKHLLEKKAQVNITTTLSNKKNDDHGKTSLRWAIQNGHDEVSLLLIDTGAMITTPTNTEELHTQFEKISDKLFNAKQKNTNPKVKEILKDIYLEAQLSYGKALDSGNYSEIALLATTLFVVNAAVENTTEDSLKACVRCAEKLNNNHSFGKKLGGLILMLVGALAVAAGFLFSIAGTAASFGLAAPIAAPVGIGIAASGAVLATGGAFLSMAVVKGFLIMLMILWM